MPFRAILQPIATPENEFSVKLFTFSDHCHKGLAIVLGICYAYTGTYECHYEKDEPEGKRMSASAMTEERLLTVQEAADWLRVNPRTIRKMIQEGRLTAYRVGGALSGEYRIAESALQALRTQPKEKREE